MEALFFTIGSIIGFILGVKGANDNQVRNNRLKEEQITRLCEKYYSMGFNDAKKKGDTYGDAPLYMN